MKLRLKFNLGYRITIELILIPEVSMTRVLFLYSVVFVSRDLKTSEVPF